MVIALAVTWSIALKPNRLVGSLGGSASKPGAWSGKSSRSTNRKLTSPSGVAISKAR